MLTKIGFVLSFENYEIVLRNSNKDKEETVSKRNAEIEQLKKTIAELEAQIKDQQWNIESLESKCKQLTDKDNKSYQQNLVLEEKILGYMNRIESDEQKSKELQVILLKSMLGYSEIIKIKNTIEDLQVLVDTIIHLCDQLYNCA